MDEPGTYLCESRTGNMEPSLARARDAVQSASQLTDDSHLREQLDSIDRGLETLVGEDAPADLETEGDRLEEIERQLVELGDHADELTLEHVEVARDHVDAFRREYAPEWE